MTALTVIGRENNGEIIPTEREIEKQGITTFLPHNLAWH